MASRRTGTRQQKLGVLRRWLILPYAAAALIILPLALIRRWNSRVTVDVTVRELSFISRASGPLVDTRSYKSAQVVERTRADLQQGTAHTRFQVSPDGSLTITSLRLDSFSITAPARVMLARNDSSTLTIRADGDASADMTLLPGSRLDCIYCKVNDAPRDSYHVVIGQKDVGRLRMQSETSRFEIAFETRDRDMLAENLPIGMPQFLTGSGKEAASSLSGPGKIVLPDLPGFEVPLQKDEMLVLGSAEDFRISRLEAVPEGLHITMTGSAFQVRTGSSSSSANRLPSLLQRLHANQALTMYFSAVVFVAGTALNVFRQLRLLGDQE